MTPEQLVSEAMPHTPAPPMVTRRVSKPVKTLPLGPKKAVPA
jgi:hypothetical protein